MRILVTGATGFIGTELLPLLLDSFAADILCIVRDSKKVTEILRPFPEIKFIYGIDEEAIREFNPDFVIHLAAYSTSQEERDDIDALVESNIRFGLHLLNALRDSTGLKLFINTGSFSQYTPSGDAYLYSASKSAFEVFLRYYTNKYNWKSITVAPYTVYGGKKTIKRIVDYIEESVSSLQPIDMTPGEQQLDFIHVRDVANFYVSAIKNYSSLTNGKVFHIGTGKITTIRQLATMVEKILQNKCNINWGGKEYRPNDIMFACAPLQSERDSIWSIQYELVTGLKKYLNS